MAGTGNRYDTGPTVAAAVGDLRGAWNNGVFVGDAELVEWATRACAVNLVANVFGQQITCKDSNPLGALAALASYSPGRVVVTEAPNDVLDQVTHRCGAVELADAEPQEVLVHVP